MSDITWTTEYPTKPGFYWIRNILNRGSQRWPPRLDPKAHIVSVIPTVPFELEPDSELEFYFSGNETRWDRESVISAEWYGPLEPPA